MSIAFFSHPYCYDHEMGPGHPERPSRLSSINDRIVASGLGFVLHNMDAPKATREQLLAVHTAAYIDRIFETAPTGDELIALDGDTLMNACSLEAALRAAGALIGAVDAVMQGEVRRAFCSVRPPGHHAERDRAMGFCIFNNIAVGAAHAMNRYKLERVAICDFDAHHGNGTEDIFQGDGRILFLSSFQHPFYPFTDLDHTAANVIKTPLPAGTSGESFRKIISEHWLPVLDTFRPQLIMISAGFDGHAEDEMSHLRLRENDYQWITGELRRLADHHCEGRIVSALEGGYNLSALKRSVAAHLDALLGNA
ncbi:MAG: histone deacetylase family protein [Gammaproteobacteria bacterium]|nr:histone deacetylase family protein [Gammaproteobacteria bacterium]MBU1653936.1 histone deacetylase family protein [Gammaproteobacteria bacterium]MBU1962604.1 histone deacetylase family protein [Gammaproteobacteria bacterium]